MSQTPPIDITYDMRTDAGGKDPDPYSATLRRYHQLLWSKPLPGGEPFTLTTDTRRVYLHHQSAVGEFSLSSDSVIHTYDTWPRVAAILSQVPVAEREEFHRLSYKIGGMMVFPGVLVDGKPTINGARGMHPRIRDRFDLTLECIRLHYLGEPSPLSAVLGRYVDFFELFVDFRGYTNFFLLQDLVMDDHTAVRFFTPFADFTGSALPESLEAYLHYRARCIEFINARNARMQEFSG